MRKIFRSNLKGVGERWVSSVRKIFPFEVILVSFHAIKIYFLCVVREHTFLFILCSSCSGLDYATHIRVWLPKITMIPPFKSFAFYPKKNRAFLLLPPSLSSVRKVYAHMILSCLIKQTDNFPSKASETIDEVAD